eukprot:g39180.t1
MVPVKYRQGEEGEYMSGGDMWLGVVEMAPYDTLYTGVGKGRAEGRSAGTGSDTAKGPVNPSGGESYVEERVGISAEGGIIRTDAMEMEKLGEFDGVLTGDNLCLLESPGSGLYDNLQEYDIPYPEAIFEINYFSHNPKPFFALAKQLYPGNCKPNYTHYFVRLLHHKKLLLRMYTQNIDGLERNSTGQYGYLRYNDAHMWPNVAHISAIVTAFSLPLHFSGWNPNGEIGGSSWNIRHSNVYCVHGELLLGTAE